MLPLNVNRVHFIGIGGYGMSALAQVLLQQGYRVSGSDLKESPLTDGLTARGAEIILNHGAENIGTAELVIYSTAVPGDNPELLEAEKRGLPLWHRSELLAALLNKSYGIAIAGAHGKTTTSAMVALLLEAGGLDPTAVIGGVVPAYGSNARLGKSRYLVAEADESDSSFIRYYPQVALVTGTEPDHLEHYGNDYNRLKEAYQTFLSHLPNSGIAVLCCADPALVKYGEQLDCTVIYYSSAEDESKRPDYYAKNIKLGGRSSIFDFYCGGKRCLERVVLNVPGRHNVSNAVGALALADRLNADLAICAAALADFRGVGRRFELIGTVNQVSVIDDYAHHPTEVRATLEAARQESGRIICIFQPHRYSRTAAFFDQFARSFDGADLLLLHAVYPAGEAPIPGASSEALADQISRSAKSEVFYSDDISTLEKRAAEFALPGDLIITMGAGDITKAAPRIVSRLKELYDQG